MGSPRFSGPSTGLCAGFLLATLRAPAGLDVLSASAAFGLEAAAVRSLGLLAVAAGLALGGRGRSFGGGLVLGVALGLGLHHLLLAPLASPTGRSGLLGWAAALALLIGALARGAPQTAGPRPPAREWTGFLLLGTGAALALEGLLRPVQRLGLGLESDRGGAALALAIGALLGSLAFGPFVRGVRGAALCLAAVPALACAGWAWLGRFDEPRALELFLKRLEVSLDSPGSLTWTLALAGGACLLPALALGAGLFRIGSASRAAALAAGAALAAPLAALLLDSAGGVPASEDLNSALRSQGLLVQGGLVALPGLVLALLPAAGAPLPLLALAAGLLACLVPRALPPAPHLLMGARGGDPAGPAAVLESSLGLFSVDRHGDGSRSLSLDGRKLTPAPEQELCDLRQISSALAALDLFGLGGAAPRVLLVGALTPAREALLEQRSGIQLERCTPWFLDDGALERLLFPGGEPRLGRRIEPREARAKLSRGEYDLVIVPATWGTPLKRLSPQDRSAGPALRCLAPKEIPRSTALVAWQAAAGPIAAQAFDGRVLLASDGLSQLAVGLCAGAAADWPAEPGADFPGSIAAGALRNRWPWQEQSEPTRQRATGWTRALTDRLAAANPTGPRAELLGALAIHAAAQVPSAPWEDAAGATELERGTLLGLGSAARSLREDPSVRVLVEGAAALATAKRQPDWILEAFGALEASGAPWPALTEALVRADLELLDGDSALARLERALASGGDLFPLELLRAETLLKLGRREQAQGALLDLIQGRPGAPDRRRSLALAAQRAGLAEARGLLQEALRLYPGDRELTRALFPELGGEPGVEEPTGIGPPAGLGGG
jgi:tetratricopeptide (TPR) repeat protein